jgi:hypothetical protein
VLSLSLLRSNSASRTGLMWRLTTTVSQSVVFVEVIIVQSPSLLFRKGPVITSAIQLAMESRAFWLIY